jgi:hypothetical protein
MLQEAITQAHLYCDRTKHNKLFSAREFHEACMVVIAEAVGLEREHENIKAYTRKMEIYDQLSRGINE